MKRTKIYHFGFSSNNKFSCVCMCVGDGGGGGGKVSTLYNIYIFFISVLLFEYMCFLYIR